MIITGYIHQHNANVVRIERCITERGDGFNIRLEAKIAEAALTIW